MNAYARIGPRGGILAVTWSATPLPGTTELTEEQAAEVAALKADKKQPFLFDGVVTTLPAWAAANGGGQARWDTDTNQWTTSPSPTAPVPRSLPNWRIKAALDLQGLTPTVDAALAAMPEGPGKIVVMRAWNGNSEVFRQSPTVTTLSGLLGLDDAQVDALFRLAASFNP